MAKSERIAIVGVGETEFARRIDRPLAELVVEASLKAIAEAGLRPADVDGMVSPLGMPMADDLAASIGIRNRAFTAHSYFGGAGNVGGALLARMAIQAGVAKAVLLYFGFQGSSPGGPYSYHSDDPVKANLEMPFGWFGQPIYFGGWAQRYRHLFGLTQEQLGEVAIAARAWASITPGAMKRAPLLDMAGYLASPMIATPLRLRDCCLISDGAVAYVMTSLEAARDLPNPPVVVAGLGVASLETTQSGFFTQTSDLPRMAARLAGQRAYADAGMGPKDMQFAEIYDCFTISEIIQIEEMGFCERGEGASFVEGGRIAPGGQFPVNTHGGLLSHSYMQSAGHVVEAVRQIRKTRGQAQLPKSAVGAITGLGGNDHAAMILTEDR